MAVKFIAIAGNVQSPSDGEIHFISCKRLAELYGVPLDEIVCATDGFKSVLYWIEKYPNAKLLRPRADGDYKGEIDMSSKRVRLAKNRADLANILTKLEGGKSSIKVGDMRQVLKLLVHFEANGYNDGACSVLAMLRKEAIEIAERLK